MPAKKRYLSGGGARTLKIITGMIFGAVLSGAMHLLVGVFLPHLNKEIFLTTFFSTFIVWLFFFLLAFCFKKGWVALLTYVFSSAVLIALIIFLK